VHVAIDARMAFAAGIGRCIRNLVPEVAGAEPQWRFTLLGDRRALGAAAWASAANIAHVDSRAPIYSAREQWRLWRDTPASSDVFWAPHYNVPMLLRKPLVVTVHDVAHLRLPEFTSSALRHSYARLLFNDVRRRASTIICVSDFSRAEFEALVGPVGGRAIVAHNGMEDAWFADDVSQRPIVERYFLFVGGRRPHKNLGTLLRAFEMLDDKTIRLVVIGDDAPTRTPDATVEALLKRLNGLVHRPTHVDDTALRAWMQHAEALVMPSFYEGFGFPPLEAMACGTPAIVSRAASLPEVCGNAALYFDPADATSLATQLRYTLNTPAARKALADAGRARARSFRWESSAAALRSALRRATEMQSHA
jgi:glycosyltransferase involved in cell wall biosynthesis